MFRFVRKILGEGPVKNVEFKRGIENPFLQDVQKAFHSLLNVHKFKIVDDSYSPQAFGDALVTMENDSLAIHVARDRGQISVSVGCRAEPSTWYLIERVLTAVTGKDYPDKFFKLREAAQLLEKHLDTLTEAFGEEQHEATEEAVHRVNVARTKGILPEFQKKT